MALMHLVRAVGRHLGVVAVGVVLTAAVLLGLELTRTGVYQVRAGVVLAPPEGSGVVNPLYRREYSVIATAGLITSMVNADDPAVRTSSSSVSLAGQGISDGYSVTLFNRGGQWVYDYDRPVIDVQAVGRTPEDAGLNFDRALSGLTAALNELHDRSEVPAAGRMRLQLVPDDPVLRYGEGRPMQARAVVVLLGAGLTLAAVAVRDARRSRPAVPGASADPANPGPDPADPALAVPVVGQSGR
ncbi:MAG: hypothetical protein ACFCVF_13945 [Kineosporiaceae bacterium]